MKTDADPKPGPLPPEEACVILTTFSEALSARQFGTRLVEMQLAACVSVFPGVESIYRWKEDVQVEGECFALIKTTQARLEDVKSYFADRHPYEEPEFLVLPVVDGSPGYLSWLGESVSKR